MKIENQSRERRGKVVRFGQTSYKAPVVRIERRKISRGSRSGGGGRGVDGMISGKDEGGRGTRSLLNRQ